MYNKSAYEKTNYIKDNLRDYIRSTFLVEDDYFRDEFTKQLNEINFVNGPYVYANLPFQTGSTIRDLVKANYLSEDFLKLDNLSPDRPLYLHQEEAVKKTYEGKNIILSTGTGSGKTESFLIPVIESIMKDIKDGHKQRGIQAMFLYPMNALANDQKDRIRDILINYPEITFGHYTGETIHNEKNALRDYRSEFDREPLSNELISREKILENPPNILFTNYSMLEYLLLRPTDQNLFVENNTSFWNYIVLDEAHTYKGSLGIEISFLLKRLVGTIGRMPNFILTSATLANESKDIPKVIEFASRLTGAKFENDSLIMSKKVSFNKSDFTLQVNPADYIDLLNKSEQTISMYLNKLGLSKSSNTKENVLNILLRDINLYNFSRVCDKPRLFDDVVNSLGNGWTREILDTFISLIIEVNSLKSPFLIDVKYHTFIRTLSGAYITIKPSKTLVLKKTKNIDDNKAFELGLCRYCNSSYLIGVVRDGVFYQTDDEDLYENYEGFEDKQSSIYLVPELSTVEDEYVSDLVTHTLCNKCGTVKKASLNSPKICDCGSEYYIELKIPKDKKNTLRTNIKQCYCCGRTNQSGVIKSFYIGKDAATALTTEFLYRTIKPQVVKNESEDENDSFFGAEEERKEKQLIIFSDSRQQASYFSAFFQQSHDRALRKRLIMHSLSLDTGNAIDLDDLGRHLRAIIKDKELFSEYLDDFTHAWIAILTELLQVDLKFSLTGLGLASFKIDINSLKQRFSKQVVKNKFPELDYETFFTLLEFIVFKLQSVPTIDYQSLNLKDEDLVDNLEYRSNKNVGFILNDDYKKDRDVNRSFIPENLNRSNSFTDYILRTGIIEKDSLKEFMAKYFDIITNEQFGVFKKMPSKHAYQISYDKFKLYDGQKIKWYKCNKCNSITDININNTCISYRCPGKLELVNPLEYHKDNYYVKRYLEKEIENVVVREHTAQLSPTDARTYQKDFKNKKINILSSSTTFEMGVDIGDLETVFMRNVPPYPSNYVQRAGRAGRGENTSSYVLTFCSTSSHDFSYFNDPLKMIEGKIIPPYFNTNNPKIRNRHILSYILSNFFKTHQEMFDNIESLLENDFFKLLREYVKNNSNLDEFIQKNIYRAYKNIKDGFIEETFFDNNSKLTIFEKTISDEIATLDSIIKERDLEVATDADRRKKALLRTRIINALANYNIIPSYGFPVDSVELAIPYKKSNYRLSRDLTLALSEYAPGSEVIVDGNKYQSQYIRLQPNAPLPKYFYKICPDCFNMQNSISQFDENLETCNQCGIELIESASEYLVPVYGFIANSNPVTRGHLKPKKTYASDIYYLGDGNLEEEFNHNNIIITTNKNSKLALINDNPFFYCRSCGYTELDKFSAPFRTLENREHRNSYTFKVCHNKKLHRTSLGHEFRTDVIIIDLSVLKFDRQTTLSIMTALLEGMSTSLEIERMDISGLVEVYDDTSRIILYDNVPGGAGHVTRLIDPIEFRNALEVSLTKVSLDCCDENTSCNNCLRNFYNQRNHDFLKRGLAKEGIREIISLLEIANESDHDLISENVESFERTTFSWKQILAMINESKLNDFFSAEIREPDYLDLVLEIEGVNVRPLFTWLDEKYMFFLEDIDNDIKLLLQNHSWKCTNDPQDIIKEMKHG